MQMATTIIEIEIDGEPQDVSVDFVYYPEKRDSPAEVEIMFVTGIKGQLEYNDLGKKNFDIIEDKCFDYINQLQKDIKNGLYI